MNPMDKVFDRGDWRPIPAIFPKVGEGMTRFTHRQECFRAITNSPARIGRDHAEHVAVAEDAPLALVSRAARTCDRIGSSNGWLDQHLSG